MTSSRIHKPTNLQPKKSEPWSRAWRGLFIYYQTARSPSTVDSEGLGAHVTEAERALGYLGTVRRFGEAEFGTRVAADTRLRNEREEQRRGVVSASKASSVVEALLALRGNGGSVKKRRKFADAALQLCESAQTWSTDGLRARGSTQTAPVDDSDEE